MTDLSTHVFALDLTSVCVSTGIVQLPMKMQPFFEDGEIEATVDGEGVRLEFAGPRRLGGFKSHFEKRGLNANDRIRFELKCDDSKAVEILAACVKRERSKPTSNPQQGAAGDNERLVAEPAAVDADVSAAPGERVGGSWNAAEGSVRAVRRVTIIGSDMLPALGSSHMNGADTGHLAKGRAPVEPVSARPTGWQALDGLSRDDHAEHAADVEFADTIVRAVRRRPHHDAVPSSGAETSAQASGVAKRPAEEADSQPDGDGQFDDAAERSTPVRLSDLVAPSEQPRGMDKKIRPAPRRGRVFAGRGPRAEHSTFASASKPGAIRDEPVVTRNAATEPIAERELMPVSRGLSADSRAAVATPLASADGSAVGGSFVRSPAAVSSDFRAGDAAVDQPSRVGEVEGNANLFHRSSATANTGPHSVSGPTNRPSGVASLVIDDADFGGEYDALRREDVSTEEVEAALTVGHDDMGSAQTPPGATNDAPGHTDLELDLNLVTEFLDRPEVPAIVRSDLVADRLGLTAERCERALERLSEGRDRVSRIRKGAYMIRRDATKRATE